MSALRSVLKLESVQRGINSTVAQLCARWRQYDSVQNYRYRCVVAIWEILEQTKGKGKQFKTGDDLAYYLFGNRFRKNRVFWTVKRELEKDCGIRNFSEPSMVNYDVLENVIPFKAKDREDLIRKIQSAFDADHLTKQEKIVLSLFFNLSCEEDSREEEDTRPWSVKEIALALGVSEGVVSQSLKIGLQKLKPLLTE